MTDNYILTETKDHVAWVTLNRPERYNAFGGYMRQQIVQALKAAAGDDDVRVVVITGTGKWFCTGGDVREFADGETKALEETVSSRRPAMCEAVLAINRMEKPVIAAVNRMAAGGGCNLALACDIRIAGDQARFAQVFTRRGVHPDWGGIYFLPRLVGYAKAAELIFSGEIVQAEEALRLGLVNQLVPQDQLAEAAREMAVRIAKNAPIPIVLAKRGQQHFYRWDLEQALDYECYVLEMCRKTADIIEGFGAFLEKREPQFKGR